MFFETESARNRAAIASSLREIADKLDAGETITLSAGDQSASLDVPARPTFEVKVERERPASGGPGELSLDLEIEWDEDESDGALSVE